MNRFDFSVDHRISRTIQRRQKVDHS